MICSRCQKPNVSAGRNVEHRPGWARTYDRGPHTARECERYAEAFAAAKAELNRREKADAAYLVDALARLAAHEAGVSA